MKDRIKDIRNSLHMSQTDFAKKLLVSRSAVCKMESGENSPSDQTIALICKEFNVNEEWLRTGEGEMFNKRTRNQELAAFMNNIIEEGTDSFKKKFILALSELNESDWETIKKMTDALSKED